MLNKILQTPIDELVEIVKNKENCPITFLKEKLKIPIEIIEKWLVILEDYKVVKVNYKGFEGFVQYINKDDKEEEIDIYKLKETFITKAQLRSLTTTQMQLAWPKFVLSYENEIKNLFVNLAKKRGYDEYKITDAWTKYREELIKW